MSKTGFLLGSGALRLAPNTPYKLHTLQTWLGALRYCDNTPYELLTPKA